MAIFSLLVFYMYVRLNKGFEMQDSTLNFTINNAKMTLSGTSNGDGTYTVETKFRKSDSNPVVEVLTADEISQKFSDKNHLQTDTFQKSTPDVPESANAKKPSLLQNLYDYSDTNASIQHTRAFFQLMKGDKEKAKEILSSIPNPNSLDNPYLFLG